MTTTCYVRLPTITNAKIGTVAQVAAQWTFDAYGAVIDDDVFNSYAPVSRCGHKGLFADRLDAGVFTIAERAADKHNIVADVLGREVKVAGNASQKNIVGQPILEKILRTGHPDRTSTTQFLF